ncbi:MULTISPECIES: spore protease YyaC [Paenibacillus]|uniref:Sporulation protein YyaC n=1 Tax=Paenibacillus sabinae T27 TaxID=1268072 RepID=X4ZHQ5_9BACL|nr:MULTISPECIES: spore protease YyaC [Paenibacillus]AHV99046.1 sporulation protein YyaC [Paenibacillus sabinae T27]NJJ42250.1 spore protease YyaC [Paenibacillus apii]
MAIREQGPGGGKRKMAADGLTAFFREIRERHTPGEVTFLCVGTDRSTGDSLGPLTGSRLLEYGFPHVVGTLPSPCDANNLTERIAEIPLEHVVIAIDACLGPLAAVGHYFVSMEPLHPAKSVGGLLPAVGHYSLAAVVDANGPKPYRTLQTTPLHRVMGMAGTIAAAAAEGFGISR